jgi:hypothetical protein
MLDIIAVIAVLSMFCLAVAYVRGADQLKGGRP